MMRNSFSSSFSSSFSTSFSTTNRNSKRIKRNGRYYSLQGNRYVAEDDHLDILELALVANLLLSGDVDDCDTSASSDNHYESDSYDDSGSSYDSGGDCDGGE